MPMSKEQRLANLNGKGKNPGQPGQRWSVNPKALLAASSMFMYAALMRAYGYDGVYDGQGGDGDADGDAEDDGEAPGDGGGDAEDEGDSEWPGCSLQASQLAEELNTAGAVMGERRDVFEEGTACYAWHNGNLIFLSAAQTAISPITLSGEPCDTVDRVAEELAAWKATGSWPGNGQAPAGCNGGTGDEGEGEGEGEGEEGEGEEEEGAPPCFPNDNLSAANFNATLTFAWTRFVERSTISEMEAAGLSLADYAAADPGGGAIRYYYMDGAMLHLATNTGNNTARERIISAISTGGQDNCVFGPNHNNLRNEIGALFDTTYPAPGNLSWPA